MNDKQPRNVLQALHDIGINPFAVTLLTESMLKSTYVNNLGAKPLSFNFPVSRKDCDGWQGVRVTLEAVPIDASKVQDESAGSKAQQQTPTPKCIGYIDNFGNFKRELPAWMTDEPGVNWREVADFQECRDVMGKANGYALMLAADDKAAGWMPTEQQILNACEEAGLWPNTSASWVQNGAFRRYHEAINRMMCATRPQPQAAQPAELVALTDEQIHKLACSIWGYISKDQTRLFKFARAVEAAHGIIELPAIFKNQAS